MREPTQLPDGYYEYCPQRANRKPFTPAEIDYMQRCEDAEKARRAVRAGSRWNGRTP